MKNYLIAASLAALIPCAAVADKPGQHPAVVVTALHATQGYDYASKFYPHPAWLYLLPEAPRQVGEDPALIATSGRQQEQAPSLPAPQTVVAKR